MQDLETKGEMKRYICEACRRGFENHLKFDFCIDCFEAVNEK